MTTAKRCPGYHGKPCGNYRDKPTQRYCRQCRADYMRWWRGQKRADFNAMMRELGNRDGLTRPTMVILLAIALGFAGIFALGRACAPRAPIVTQPDTGTVGQVIDRRPEPGVPHGVGSIIHDTVPVAVTVTREVPDSGLVERYAKLALRFAEYRHRMEQRTPADTTPPPIAPPEILPPVAMSYTGKQLTMWLTPSSGRAARYTALVQPHWSMVAGRGGASDSRPIVVQDRAWVRTGREVKGCLVPAAVFTLVGALVVPKAPVAGAIGGAVGGTGACLWD